MASAIGILALQGSFDLHARSLERLGAPARKVRLPADLEGLRGLIIPGGESTVMAGVAMDSGLFEAIRSAGAAGLPMFGTCAGAILLGRGAGIPSRLELAPLELDRNAYGSQWDSFEKPLALNPWPEPFPGIFIRAPRMRALPPAPGGGAAEILGRDGEEPVLARWKNLLLSTFHPELTEDLRIHRYFLESVR